MEKKSCMKVIFSSVYSCLWFPSVKDVFVKYSKVEKILKGSNDLIPSPLTDKWHILASAASDRKSAKIHHDFSWFYQKKICSKELSSFDDLIISATKMTNTGPFCGIIETLGKLWLKIPQVYFYFCAAAKREGVTLYWLTLLSFYSFMSVAMTFYVKQSSASSPIGLRSLICSYVCVLAVVFVIPEGSTKVIY